MRRVLLSLLVALWASAPLTAQPPDVESEAESDAVSLLEAEFIHRITQFVEWPDEAFDRDDAFVVCTYGETRVTDHLRELMRGVRIQGSRARVSKAEALDSVNRCHVLFVGDVEEELLSRVLDETADRPILTIGDREGFGQRGGLMNFYREGDYVRFEINVAAVDRSGLRVAAQLMRLGRLIAPESAGDAETLP